MEHSEKFKCYVCNENFDQYGLELHYATTHAFEEETDKSQDNNRCEQCDKCFTRKDNLNRHIKKIHKGRKNHECEYCGKSFSQGINLKDHIKRVHNKVKKEIVHESDKTFHEYLQHNYL